MKMGPVWLHGANGLRRIDGVIPGNPATYLGAAK